MSVECEACGRVFDSPQGHSGHLQYCSGLITKNDLAADVERVAVELGRSPSVAEYRERGEYSISPFRRLWGSWADAKRALGYEVGHTARRVTRDEIVADLRRVADELGRSPSGSDYAEHGRYATSTAKEKFGLWNDAKRAAGLETLEASDSRHSPLEFMDPEDIGLSPIGERGVADAN